MKEFNVSIMLETRLRFFDLYNSMSMAELDAIETFLIDTMIDLNEFNMDDFIINGLSFIGKEELEEYRDEYMVLFEDEDSAIILQ